MMGDSPVIPPQDPALAPFDFFLSGEQVADKLARRLLNGRLEPFHVESCRPAYTRYKPSASLAIRYEVALRDQRTGERLETFASALLYADERVDTLWGKRQSKKLLSEAGPLYSPITGGASLMPEFRALLQLFPVDLELPAMASVASGEHLKRVILRVFPHWAIPHDAEWQPKIIRYRPGLKSILVCDLPGTNSERIYLKVKNSRRSAQIFEVNRAIANSGIPTPAPLAFVQDLGMAVYGAAPGIPLTELTGSEEFVGWMRPTAEALLRLHQTHVEQVTEQPREKEIDAVRSTGEVIGTLLPHRAAEVHTLVSRLTGALSRVEPCSVTVHGDFYDDQILVSPDGLSLLDFEETRRGHPLLDVGNFLAHLSILPGPVQHLAERARKAFLDGYGIHCADCERHVLLFEALSLLPLVLNPFRRLDADWPTGMMRKLRLVIRRLKEYDSTVSGKASGATWPG